MQTSGAKRRENAKHIQPSLPATNAKLAQVSQNARDAIDG